MKRLIANLTSVLICLLVAPTLVHAAPLRECRVTQVVSDVKLLPEQAPPRPAEIDDRVANGTAVRTGTRSRSELTFVDQTMTRLGANTIFSFRGEPAPPAEGPANLSMEAPSHLTRNAFAPSRGIGSRVMHLNEGAMLFQVPKGAGGATIQSPLVTAAVTGTTGIGECHAASDNNAKPIAKWFCLEGHVLVKLNDGSGQSVELGPGQMVVTDGTYLPEPTYFDIAAMANSSPLLNPRPANWDAVEEEIQRQTQARIDGTLIDVNAVASDKKQLMSELDQAMAAQFVSSGAGSPTPTPITPTPTPVTPTPTPTPVTPTPTPITPTPTPSTPTPTPGKFGALATITSPDPFVIDENTLINTDPTITRAVATGFGKIYRTSGMDGSRTIWMFGATSAFDNASGFDHGTDTNFLNNIAGFKFQNLVLAADPTIDTSGGVTNLALVGVNGITTSGSGSTFTFTGIDTLLLATQNGSINLQSGHTFNGPNRIYLYARGSSSSLTVNCNILVQDDLRFYSQSTVDIGGSLEAVNFSSFSGGNFTNTSGSLTAGAMNITTQTGDIIIDTGAFHARSAATSLVLVAGNAVSITMGSDLSMFESFPLVSISGDAINLNADDVVTLNLNVTSPATFTAGGGGINAPNVSFVTRGGLELRADGDIDIFGAQIPIESRVISGVIDAGGSFHAVSDVTTGELRAGGDIAVDEGNVLVSNLTGGTTFENAVSVGGNITALGAINAAGTVIANDVYADTINTGGAVYAENVNTRGDIVVGTDPGDDDNPNFDRDLIARTVTTGGTVNAYGVAVATLSMPNRVLTVGDDGIFPFVDPDVGANLQHTITADSIVSSGGIFFISAFYGGAAGLSSGGLLTINARTILFDDGSNGIGFTDFDGANVGDFGGAVGEAGDGGTLIVRTTGNITQTADSIIIARTGLTPPDLPFGGTGGTVTFDSSSGSVSVDGLIRVSQATSFESHGDPQRRSANGGHINLHSGLTSGQAISILENASLEALFHDDAPGEAGAINVISEGGNITVEGNLEAERGAITISNAGLVAHPRPAGASSSLISLDGATLVTGTLNVFSIGNLAIGLGSTAALDAPTTMLHADGNFDLGTLITLATARDTTGDVMLSAGGNITFDNISIERTNLNVVSGFNFSVVAQGNITGSQTLRLLVDHAASSLGEGANITVDAGQAISVGALNLAVNNTGGQIGAGGTIAVNAAELSAGSVDALINNQNGGQIGSGATIDFNVSEGANITNNANLQVLGSDNAGGATITVNGGDYAVGGTFRAFTDGNGTIGLNNASIHADVLKVGALGSDGVLNIGGGTLSADTTLKLYASGSNGQLNFISDVTLSGNSTKTLAANSVTILDNVVVTIGGANAADVFANNANYSGDWGGNDSTTGTFSGAGANAPQPLSDAPGFDDAGRPDSASASTSGGNSPSTPAHGGGGSVTVSDSGQLLSLLDGATVGPNGKVIVPNSHRRNEPENPNHGNPGDRGNVGRQPMDLPRKSRLGAKPLLP